MIVYIIVLYKHPVADQDLHSNLAIKNANGHFAQPPIVFRFFRILTVIAVALCIAGLTANMSAKGLAHPNIKTKVGMILYAVSWALMVLLLLVLFFHRDSLERGDHRILLAVAISSPFLFVRLLYAFFVLFLHDATFSMIGGNVTVRLVMSVLEEFVVVIVCLAVGWTLRVREIESRPIEEAPLSPYPVGRLEYAPKHQTGVAI